jgi:eukaryotic-like serine/threonine-protein kinase
MSAAHEPSAPLTGKMLGRYRIVSRLAVGGMAELWLALRTSLSGASAHSKENSKEATGDAARPAARDGQQVVLKTMLPSVAESSEFVRMFLTEAAIGARLRHPNLVRVIDHGRLADRYFIAMEYIDGLTLRQIGQRVQELGQVFPQRLLLTVAIDICRGLHTAHELRDRGGLVHFVHRDVSPENIMVSRTGVTKLIDFGAAATLRIPPNTARFVGKFRYVAPERIEGRAEDRRGDVYSLGVILYEYLTGVRPFEGDDLAMVSRILEGRPRSPVELVPALEPELCRIVLKALALDPDQRYRTAADLAADLLPLLEGPGCVAAAEECRQLLRRIFAPASSAEGESEPIVRADDDVETEAKTVEMEVDALKEVLRRTRDDITVVRRARAAARNRTVVTEARQAASANRPVTTRPSRPGARPVPAPVVGTAPIPTPAAADHAAPVPTPVVPARWPTPLSTSAAPHSALDPDLPAALALPPTPAPLPTPPPHAAAAQLPPAPAPTGLAPLSPSWLFDRRGGTAAASMPSLFGAHGGRDTSGCFDIRRLDRPAHNFDDDERPAPVTTGFASRPLPAPFDRPSPPPPVRRRPPVPEAVRCFDRGLSLLQDKLYAAALAEWEKAVELDGDNRMYQVNVKRLRERMVRSSHTQSEERT